MAARTQPPGKRRALAARALAIVTFACCTFAPTGTRAADLPAVYSDVKPSVVFIVCALSDGVSSGSGFVYASGETTSSIVTANHVVEGAAKIDVILDSDPRRRYHATVVKRDHVHDIAELSIPVGHRIALELQDARELHEGMSIAEIGYPRAVVKFEHLMGDHLRPSVHSGIVSAIRLDGEIIQFDAETDHGDSGGPVIDAKSGRVIGVVRGSLLDQSYLSAALETLPGSNFAVSSSTIIKLLGDLPRTSGHRKAADDGMASADRTLASADQDLAAAKSHLASATSGMVSANAKMTSAKAAVAAANGTAPENVNLPRAASSAAYRVGFATPHYDDPNVDAADTRLATRLAEHFASGNAVYVVPVAPGVVEASTAKLAGYCDDTRLNAIIVPHVRLSGIEPPVNGSSGGRKSYVTLDLLVTDCSGKPFFFGEKTAPRPMTFASRSQDRDVIETFNGMLDKLIGDFERFTQAHARAWTSLLQMGFALDPQDDRYYSLFGIDQNKQSKEWRTTSVYADGPGADAGLQPGDTIIAIDGKPTRGVSIDAFRLMTNTPNFAMSVLRPGGLIVLQVQAKKYAELQATLAR